MIACAAALHQLVVALLNRVDARLDLLLGKWWQVWQARLMLSSGLRTQWSEILVAPSRMYGMWQSAQATPLRAWMPWLHSSNSGCCALRIGAGLGVLVVEEPRAVGELRLVPELLDLLLALRPLPHGKVSGILVEQ